MKVAPKYVKPAQIAVLVLTTIVGGAAVMAGLGSALLIAGFRIFASLRGHSHEELPVEFYQGMLIVVAVLLPAVLLILFYLRCIFGCPSRGVLLAGWSASAVFHTGLTLFLIVQMPTASLGRDEQAVPIAILTGLASLFSILLSIQSHPSRSGNSKSLLHGNTSLSE